MNFCAKNWAKLNLIFTPFFFLNKVWIFAPKTAIFLAYGTSKIWNILNSRCKLSLHFFSGFLDSQRPRCGSLDPWDCCFHLRPESHSMPFFDNIATLFLKIPLKVQKICSAAIRLFFRKCRKVGSVQNPKLIRFM